MYPPAPVANGIRTDHPIPGLPFVDDSLLDLSDGSAIEKIGRHSAEGMWGRVDLYPMLWDAWRAFTTDPTDNDYAWLVIHHPSNGTTVTLYSDDDIVKAYDYRAHDNDGVIPLIVRAGGYWSDGQTWRRPTSTRDPVGSTRIWDTPDEAMNWTAPEARLDALPGDEVPLPDLSSRAVSKGIPAVHDDSTWRAVELAAWEEARATRANALPLERCVVEVITPELSGTNLLGSTEAAEQAGVGASTWRAYVARGTAPAPQRNRSGRPHWAKPIIDAYVARSERDAPRPVPPIPDDTAVVVDRIREDIYRAGRKSFKPGQTSAMRDVLSGKIVGLCSNNYVVESMHAAWMLSEFTEMMQSHTSEKTLPGTVVEQVESLVWLNRYVAESAVSMYVSKGIDAGFDREALEYALLGALTEDSHTYAVVKEAVTPKWG